MADKLDWINKHLVLLRYITLKDVIEKEGYKIRPDLEEFFTGVNGAEAMVFKFADAERYKCAAELMAYIAHRRAAIWWGYRCVSSLAEELRINPAVERDIADIGANREPQIPEWANIKPPEPPPEEMAKIENYLAQMQEDYQKARSAVDPKLLKTVEDAVEGAFQQMKAEYGIHPMEALKQLGERIKQDPYEADPNSPIFQEAAKLKEQVEAMRKETVETIKSVIPPKVPAHQKKLRDNALDAVYRWVAAPDAENSQKCLDMGNECPDTPAGLLSLSAFWAYGDLMPLGEQTVPTPPGLAANGLCQTLLFCAVHPGGIRKLKERYAEYFRLGMEVLTGADNWEASLVAGKAPHREEVSSAVPPRTTESPASEQEQQPDNGPVYKRWKPEAKI